MLKHYKPHLLATFILCGFVVEAQATCVGDIDLLILGNGSALSIDDTSLCAQTRVVSAGDRHSLHMGLSGHAPRTEAYLSGTVGHLDIFNHGHDLMLFAGACQDTLARRAVAAGAEPLQIMRCD